MSENLLRQWAAPRRILVATDLTDLAFTLPIAMQQAKAFNAEVRLAHILPNPMAPLVDPVLLTYVQPDRVHHAAEQKLQSALDECESIGLRCSCHLIAGDIADELTTVSRQWKADRLIAGSHGKGKFHSNILGSVAQSLFHRIDIPVLAVGPHSMPWSASAKRPMKIVLATSLDHNSKYMAEFALQVAHEHRAELSLLHVIPIIPSEHPAAERVLKYANNSLQDLLATNPQEALAPTYEIVEGEPATEIIQYAQSHSTDMIILGAPAHSTFDLRFVPGTAYRVLCEAVCPVLVLKHQPI